MLERLNLQELREVCTELTYDFLSSTEEQFFQDSSYVDFNSDYPTPMDMVYKETQDTIEENKQRIKMFEEAIAENQNDKEVVDTLQEQLQPLLEEREHFTKSCMKYMKDLYKKTGLTDYSRNLIRIPLDKRINSFYDDLILEVLFYDDIGVNAGKYDEYRALTTQAERREFIKQNIEITHFGLVVLGRSNNQVATIGLLGKLDFNNERVKQAGIILLPEKFADFSNLTLAETMTITQNNDLRQLLQSKIDLDKEKMKKLAEWNMCSDEYRLYLNEDKKRKTKEYFIRYVCPSTQRVYYNPINTEYLSYSEYFKENDYKSWLISWWNVTHLGANPMAEEYNRA